MVNDTARGRTYVDIPVIIKYGHINIQHIQITSTLMKKIINIGIA